MKFPEDLQKAGKALMKYKYLLIVIAAGLVLLVWPKSNAPPETPVSVPEETLFSLELMEQRIADMLSSIQGAGCAEVMLTLKTDMEMVVVQDTDIRTHQELEDGKPRVADEEAQTKTVLTSSSGNGGPIVTKRIYPQFQGALIVCDGADDANVQMAVLEAVTALTGLRSDAVTVVKRKG